MDLYQPSGVGRRKRSNDYGVGRGEAVFVREDRLVDEGAMKQTFFPITTRATFNNRGHESTDVKDNVGLTVVMPEQTRRNYYQGSNIQTRLRFEEEPMSTPKPTPSFKTSLYDDDCHNFVIIGAVLGSLLVAASAMMCILSHRLYKLTKRYRREKLDDVVREHRRKFGNFSQATLFSSRRQQNPLQQVRS